MQRKYYIVEVQYLGFRFHGWQKQPNVKTIQLMIERTLAYVLQHKNFKILAAGRTDAKVSVNQSYFELFLDEGQLDIPEFLSLFNLNLPQDIKVLSIIKTDAKFNIIQCPKIKEYIYLFSFGEKNHPFAAPFMVNFPEILDVNLMQEAAIIFEGTHNFRNYIYKPTITTQTEVAIITCKIEENTIYTANFFPKKSYVLKVIGTGFKRNQIRLIMAKLIQLGKGELSILDIKTSLNKPDIIVPITYIAPASGLILNKVTISSELLTDF